MKTDRLLSYVNTHLALIADDGVTDVQNRVAALRQIAADATRLAEELAAGKAEPDTKPKKAK